MSFIDVKDKMYQQGLLDERKCATLGVVDSPLGEFSSVISIKGNALKIYLSDASMKLGSLRHEFAICNLRDVKIRSFFLAPKISFSYGGKHYAITRFGDARNFLAVFQKEVNGR